MKEKYDQFVIESPLAQRIKLPGRVVIQRTRFCPREIAALRQKGMYAPVLDETCDLVIGGQVIAAGKIIEKDDAFYFQPSNKTKEEKK